MPQAAEILPPTPKQVDYARAIAARAHVTIPAESAADRRALSEWIAANQARMKASRGAATSRQVALAERLARAKRAAVPEECFRDAGLMSRWIDTHLGARARRQAAKSRLRSP